MFFLTKNRILGFPSPPRHRFGTEGTLSEAPEERPTFSGVGGCDPWSKWVTDDDDDDDDDV